MKPKKKSKLLLGVTRSKAKMFEYDIPKEYHIMIQQDPANLFALSVGLLGDLAVAINRKEQDLEILNELQKNLIFSAHFFDSYPQSKLNQSLDPYLMLLSSASYYLCDLPGSSVVLAKQINHDLNNSDSKDLESLLLWLLRGELLPPCISCLNLLFGKIINLIYQWIIHFFQYGKGEDELLTLATLLRDIAYQSGSPRQLLLSDTIAAVLLKKIKNSSWVALPSYSNLPKEKWTRVLEKKSFIKELWPAQHLLGQENIFRGESGIVQMPTSAGKTKAVELIIRSAFLSERTLLTVIVAPFRSLCHEIKSSLVAAFDNELTEIAELSDVLQVDFEISELLGHQQILVLTPEKCLYVLRHFPEFILKIGLLVFDEGHLFDDDERGVTYELLITSLRSMVPEKCQKILISAVISNGEKIGLWLNGNSKVVKGINLNPTYRSLGFVSWLDPLGRIEYVTNDNPEQNEFFIPRVIQGIELDKKTREIKQKIFPNKLDKTNRGKEIALYLGLKLIAKGAVAIFCARKDTASALCEIIADRFARGLPLSTPNNFSNSDEVLRLNCLVEKNIGKSSPEARSAQLGVFSHHGNTPHGIRLAVEHAMRKELIRFVICTSTLAQGVNLPLRYLIVTSIYQSAKPIKVRDFQNLIGRVGRAGMHTEGTILFADPSLYDDKRKNRKGVEKWSQVKDRLELKKSEPCISNLLSIFDPIKSDNSTYPIDVIDFTNYYISNPDDGSKIMDLITRQINSGKFKKIPLLPQITKKIRLIASVESFLLSHWDEAESLFSEEKVTQLAERTLAFFLADEPTKQNIRKLFRIIAENIFIKVPDQTRRKVYGKLLYGIRDALLIESWVENNYTLLAQTNNANELLSVIWPLLATQIHNGVFKKFNKPEILKKIIQQWIVGSPFYDLLQTVQNDDVKLRWGEKYRDIKINHIINLCESGLAYDGALLISAICEFVEVVVENGNKELIDLLQLFQKQIKYGLPTKASIVLYESGFSDRVIALDLATSLDLANENKNEVLQVLRVKKSIVFSVIDKYPSYFHENLDKILSSV